MPNPCCCCCCCCRPSPPPSPPPPPTRPPPPPPDMPPVENSCFLCTPQDLRESISDTCRDPTYSPGVAVSTVDVLCDCNDSAPEDCNSMNFVYTSPTPGLLTTTAQATLLNCNVVLKLTEFSIFVVDPDACRTPFEVRVNGY
jgi:hypothetical protein